MIRKYHRLLLAFLAGIGLIRFYLAGIFNLIPQEAYYWSWSKHLDLSYFDHPPVIAYLIRFFTFLGGDREIFVRLGAIVLSLSTSYVLYLLGKEMYNEKIGFYAAVFLNLGVIFPVKAIIVDPDGPLFFFWILTIYFTYRAINSPRKYYWYLSGISLGFSLLSKYVGFVLFPSILFFLFLCREKRFWLKRKEPYLAFALALIVFFPVILWNSRNHWISFSYQFFYRGTQTTYPSLKLFFGHILAQMGIITPLLFIGLMATLYHIGKKGFREQNPELLFLFSTSFPILMIFLCISPFYWIKAHWTVPGYIPLFIAFTAINIKLIREPWFFINGVKKLHLDSEDGFIKLAKIPEEEGAAKDKKGKFLKASIVSGFILTVISYLLLFLPPNVIPAFSNIYGGWDRMGSELNLRINGEFGKDETAKEKFFVFTENYKLSSLVKFYTGNKYPVYANNILGEGAKAYDYWEDPRLLKNRDAFYLFEKAPGQREKIEKYFTVVEELSPIEIQGGGRVLKRIGVFRCYGYKGL